ncbi:integumentary mucin A.1-like isoform X1 [Cyprinodon tularosa]|uniref:integumentary mucin A.1-like isoform X1 n=1 Tax=Cyprinodon tularosa TaxID=77115 RepID=UPI0018E2755E|nr:integumentary mucin A.1-like isoform X1 [Cyprinodon tularosa]
MPAAMYLTLLLTLVTVTICSETTAVPETAGGELTTTTASHATLNFTTSSSAVTTAVTPQNQTATQNTTEASLTSPQTPTAEKTSPSSPPLNTTTSQTSNETVTEEQEVPSTTLNVTAGTSTNTTTSALSDNKDNYNWAANPGLVAVICIFCMVFGLLLVVIMVKCVRSSRPSFERLEDLPLGKVNEASPFAQYSK